MKKFLLLLVVAICTSTAVLAADVKVQINGEIISFKDENGNIVDPQIIGGRTMVPMRKIFELLGLTVEWDAETRTVTGTKDDILIGLQIDNTTAWKVVNGTKTEIELDTAPTIVSNRTLVPLRFIAESIQKQVGWDGTNRTAIIIDYSYFTNQLANTNPSLFEFFKNSKDRASISYTKNYYDLENGANNNSIVSKMSTTLNGESIDISLSITGSSELAREINSEGWSNTTFSIKHEAEEFLFSSNDAMINKMIVGSNAGTVIKEKALNLTGSYSTNFDDIFRVWAGIDDNRVTINTFTNLKNDFNKLCDILKNMSTSGSTIKFDNYNLQYFDLFKLDNIVSGNSFLDTFNFVTKMFFREDAQKDIALYDYNRVVLKYTSNAENLIIRIEAYNDYNEKNEIIIEMNHA